MEKKIFSKWNEMRREGIKNNAQQQIATSTVAIKKALFHGIPPRTKKHNYEKYISI